MPKKARGIKGNEETLLTFLKRTKEGEFAPIDENSLLYARITDESERLEYSEDEYYFYSIG